MNYLNKFFITLLALSIIPVYGLEFDVSVDEEIRKNYNPSKLELEGLPPLPQVKETTPSKPVTSIPRLPEIPQGNLTKPVVKPVISKIDKSTAIRIKKGTKFQVKSCAKVSDWTGKGARLSFTTLYPVTQTYITIPQGTVFKGKVVDSHTPQLSGNGGLIVLGVDSMIFKGSTVGVNAKITKADNKKIFFNNIKGERKYVKGIAESTKPGQRFYKKMMKTTSKLANGNFTLILTPFTAVAGVGAYAINVVGSPLIALFKKGGHITIPAGSEFEIKLLEDVYLN